MTSKDSRLAGSTSRLPIYLLCALITIEGSRAIECYECNSHVDSRCADDQPPSSMKKPCHDLVDGSKYTLCRKIDQRVEFKVNGLPENARIIRSCGWDESRYKNECYDRSGFGGAQRVCSCSTDNCNGAVHRSPTSFYIFGSSLVLPILIRKIST
ncbi:uncharacterized protein LOC110116968 isoform X2 [Athalia rosae]|uniref:uncharacterized protein LOC110116968 isoform X2 n=1 Tax=Athalia rosae TaxID=37344 RepID=UPI00203348C0|nr:uncharacterized protein LOC110116968 isoform X2 [Athalia rosae]